MSWLDAFFTSRNYNNVQDEGAAVAPQPTLDFVGTGVEVTNDAANLKSIVTITAGGTVPTGTGIPHVVAGVENAAASLIVNADVHASAAIALSKLVNPTGTGVALVSGGAFVSAAGTVNLASGTYVTGTLPVANGGTGITSLGSGVATFLGTPSSANLAAAVTGKTGSGALVFGTGPTLSAPIIATISNTGTITLPTSTDTLVGRGTTDTLTNKTLTGPVINTPNFGSNTIATSGHFTTAGNVSTSGNFRLAQGDKITYRNAGNSADATFMHTSGDTLYIGLNSGFADAAYQIIQCPSQTQYLGVASNYFWIINNNLLECNAPILGYLGAEFAVHGAVDSAMVDANYTAATADKRVETVSLVNLMTAGRTMTWPHPSSLDRSYKKLIRNTAATTQTVTISTGTGTTKTLATDTAQWFEFTPAGVRAASGTFTP